jgi:hypothetical protein
MLAIDISFSKSLSGQCSLPKRIVLPGYNELTVKKPWQMPSCILFYNLKIHPSILYRPNSPFKLKPTFITAVYALDEFTNVSGSIPVSFSQKSA